MSQSKLKRNKRSPERIEIQPRLHSLIHAIPHIDTDSECF